MTYNEYQNILSKASISNKGIRSIYKGSAGDVFAFFDIYEQEWLYGILTGECKNINVCNVPINFFLLEYYVNAKQNTLNTQWVTVGRLRCKENFVLYSQMIQDDEKHNEQIVLNDKQSENIEIQTSKSSSINLLGRINSIKGTQL